MENECEWVENRAKIEEASNKRLKTHVRTKTPNGAFPEVDKKVYEGFLKEREENRAVSGTRKRL